MSKKIVIGETRILLTSDEHINFPRFFQAKDGRQFMAFSEGYHKLSQTNNVSVSDDGGKTWEPSRGPLPLYEFDDGTLFSLLWGMYHSAYSEDLKYYGNPKVRVMGTMHSTDGGETWVGALYHITFPFVLASIPIETGTLMLPDGTLLQVCNGLEEGAKYGASMLIASQDQGHSWEYRGTAGPPESHRDRLGFGETGIAYHPPSGDLVALFSLYRAGWQMYRGWSTPDSGALYLARSSDLGCSWSDPEMILDEHFEYIAPDMICLEDGTLVTTYGTRHPNLAGEAAKPGGVWLMHSEDGGHSWEEPLLVWDGPSCNKSCVWHMGGQQFKFFHSRSGFCHLEPDRENNSIGSVGAELA